MSIITRREILAGIANRKSFEVNYDFAKEAVKQLDFDDCERYSKDHYLMIYTILSEKINTLKDVDEKLAYINSLTDTWRFISDTGFIDAVVGILNGSIFGVAILDEKNNGLLAFLSIVTIILLLIKAYAKYCKRYIFYFTIFEHLKSNIDTEEKCKPNHMGLYIEERHTVRVKLKRR